MEKWIKNISSAVCKDVIIGVVSSIIIIFLGNLTKILIPADFVQWYEEKTNVDFSLTVSVVVLISFVLVVMINQYILNYSVTISKWKVYRTYSMMDVSMMINSRQEMQLRTKCKCVSKISLRNYPLVYRWTGSSSYAVSNLPDAEAKKDLIQSDLSDKWELEFRSPKEAGRPFDIDFTVYAEDKFRVSKPVFGFHVNCPVEKLTIKLSFNAMDPELRLKYMNRVCKLSTSDIIISSEPLDHDLNIYKLEINKPKLLHTYRFEWAYE